MFRIDLHVHTNYSHDAASPIPQLVKVAKRKGLSGFAITDHDTINGHPQAKTHSSKDFLIIPGIEVYSKEGHILGLMVNEDIPRGLSVEEITERIREQGGIAVAAHPFTPFRTFKKIDRNRFDAVEVLNSHAHFISNPLARKFAQREHFPVTAGSDAHFPDEIGLAGVEVGGSLKPDSVLEEIRRGKAVPFGRTISLQRHLKRSIQKTLIFWKKRGGGEK